VLGNLPVLDHDDRVLVDYRTSDDAGVYWLSDNRALVQTVDFFTPVVDDPIAYGRIAGANALSDIYAMGARPLTALAIAGFPKDADRAVLSQIFQGGVQALREAGAALLGGHTVQDQEIKFGYAVTGEVDPARMWTNAGARPGDRLILTKPLGTGVIATAIKFGRTDRKTADAAIASMVQLNKAAAEALSALDSGAIHACTDITGFGLVGHATEMALASGCVVQIDSGRVPLLEGALDLVEGNTPGGGRTNKNHFGGAVRADAPLDARLEQLLYDPQTSGGLLVAVAPGSRAAAMDALRGAGVVAHEVGSVLGSDEGHEPPRDSRGDARTVALRQAQDNRGDARTVAVILR
jgi:selenide,water dikinase